MSVFTSLTAPPSGPRTPRQLALRVGSVVLSLACAAILVGWLLPLALGTSWGRIGAVLGQVSPLAVAGLCGVALVAVLIDSWGFRACWRALRWGHALRTNLAAQCVSTVVPFGATVSLGVVWAGLRRTGLRAAAIAAGLVLASAADLLSHVCVPVLALFALACAPEPVGAGWRIVLAVCACAALVTTVLLVRALASTRVFTGLLARVQDIYDSFREGYGSESRDLSSAAHSVRETALTNARGSIPTVLALPSAARLTQGIGFALWCMYGLELEVSFPVLLAVFACGRLLSLLPLTPGGLGVTDAGVAWALTWAGVSAPMAVTATLVFTLTQAIVPVALGALCLPSVAGLSAKAPATEGSGADAS